VQRERLDLAHLPPVRDARATARSHNAEPESIGSSSTVPFVTARNQLIESFERRYLTRLADAHRRQPLRGGAPLQATARTCGGCLNRHHLSAAGSDREAATPEESDNA